MSTATAIELRDVFRVHSTREGDAAALQGAIFAIVKAAVDRASAEGVRKLTGSWPA